MIAAQQDNIGIVTCHDGPSLAPGEIIAPPVSTDADDPDFHNNYQDPEAFLRAGDAADGNTRRSLTAPISLTVGSRPSS